MINDEQILAAIEELSKQLDELKKTINQPNDKTKVDLSPISSNIVMIEDHLQRIKTHSNSTYNELNYIKSVMVNLLKIIEKKQSEVIHRVIEIKDPQWWLIGLVSFFLICVSISTINIVKNNKLKQTIESIQPNDYKYRYLKLKGFEFSDLKSEITNTNKLIYYIDLHYKENQDEIKSFVIQREEELRQIFEANELAKQKELEAKKAHEEAKRIKSKFSKDN